MQLPRPVTAEPQLSGRTASMAMLRNVTHPHLNDSSLTRVKSTVKAALNRWPTAKALAYVADDLTRGWKQQLGHIRSESGSTHWNLAIGESVSYVEEVFNDYLAYSGVVQVNGAAAEIPPE